MHKKFPLFLFLMLIFITFSIEASFYSIKNKETYELTELTSNYNLVVLASKDCAPCKRLYLELKSCELSKNFKIAWIASKVSFYNMDSLHIDLFKTNEKTIQKLTTATPKSILNGESFKEGLFNCQQLEKAI